MTSGSYTDIKVRLEPDEIVRYSAPGVCYRSELCTYDESLIDGSLLGRCWYATGHEPPELHILRYFDRPEALHLPNHAFDIELDGQSLHNRWRWVAFEELQDKPGCRHGVIELEHEVRPVRLYVHTRLDGTPIIERWLEIENIGESPAALSRVSPWAGRLWTVDNYKELMSPGDEQVFTLGYMSKGHWCHEGEFVWEPLQPGVTTKTSRIGCSGHRHPFFIVRNEATGEYFVGSLGWSGNHYMEFRVDMRAETGVISAPEDAYLFFKAGPLANSPIRMLDAGEKVRTPSMHLGCMHGDFDSCIQSMHEHVRRSVLPPEPRRPLIEFNNMGYIEDWYVTEDSLKEMVDSAARVGAEVFVIDAGWYGPKEHSWPGNRGDYYAGSWLPNDLFPVREYAREKGLLFGLWMDAESIGANACIKEKHPDWEIKSVGNPNLPTGVLDLSQPEVASYVEEMIADLIERYDLDLFRLDYNSRTGGGGERLSHGYAENTMWRYQEAFYAMFERLRLRFPKVIFENCASGGGRIDYGIMRLFHHTQVTDEVNFPRNLVALNGITMMMPPEALLQWAGIFPNLPGPQRGDLPTQYRVAIMGTFAVSGGLAQKTKDWNPLAEEVLRHHIEIFKDFIRPLMPACRVFHHTPLLKGDEASEWCVLEYAAPDKEKALVVLFRMTGSREEYQFTPRGLSRSYCYRVTLDNQQETVEMSGKDLADRGIAIRLESRLTSQVLLIERG